MRDDEIEERFQEIWAETVLEPWLATRPAIDPEARERARARMLAAFDEEGDS